MSAVNGREMPPRAEREDYGFVDKSLAELRELWALEMADKPGECVCPVIDGVRGFKVKCPVHGGRDRSDFARLTALRVEIASRCKTPASARKWGKEGSK